MTSVTGRRERCEPASVAYGRRRQLVRGSPGQEPTLHGVVADNAPGLDVGQTLGVGRVFGGLVDLVKDGRFRLHVGNSTTEREKGEGMAGPCVLSLPRSPYLDEATLDLIVDAVRWFNW